MWKKIFIIGFVLLLLISGGFFLSAQNRITPALPRAELALEDSPEVDVTINQWQVFEPKESKARLGFIFYPGGLVDETAYAPLLHSIAAEGFLVVNVPMPLGLASNAPHAANDVIPAFPDIENWVIGGHSQGGVSAADHVASYPMQMSGLVFWAGVPSRSNDISDLEIEVLLIHGSNDRLVRPWHVNDRARLLPSDTSYIEILGGNHAQFGDYGIQRRDGEAEIPIAEQHQQTIDATVEFLKSLQN